MKMFSAALETYLKLTHEAEWREKQVKLIGYVARFFGACANIVGADAVAQRLGNASFLFSTGRRLLWLGRVFQNIPWLYSALAEKDLFTKILSLCGIMFGSVCSLFDDCITLQRVGILPPGTVNLPGLLSWTSRLWMSLTLCTITLNRLRLRRLSERLAHAKAVHVQCEANLPTIVVASAAAASLSSKGTPRRLIRSFLQSNLLDETVDGIILADIMVEKDEMEMEMEDGDKLDTASQVAGTKSDLELKSITFQQYISTLSEFKLCCDLGMNVCYSFALNPPQLWFAC
mgnify:FL=1